MTKNKTKDWKKVRDEHEDQELNDVDESLEEAVSPDIDIDTEALGHPSYKALEDKLTDAEQKAHEHWEKSMRMAAELENVRRRAEKDVENAHRYGLEKLIDSLLPVMDSLEQALNIANESADEGMRDGIQLTMKLFLDVLQKRGVEQLNPEGKPFDPQVHEAISIQASADAEPNTVLAVFQKGYKLHDRIIRPARVIVAKKQ